MRGGGKLTYQDINGCAGLNGSLFHKKSLNMGPIFCKSIPMNMGPFFQKFRVFANFEKRKNGP